MQFGAMIAKQWGVAAAGLSVNTNTVNNDALSLK